MRGPEQGCVVLAHGLNTTPAVMSDLARLLGEHGYHCGLVLLHADPRPRTSPEAVAAGWLAAFDEATAQLTARHPGLPVAAVGYSLGGLVALLRAAGAATGPPVSRLDRLVLWAPPLALTRYASTVRLLAPSHRLGLRLPSATPRSARARWATPVVEYAALLRLVDEAGRLSPSTLDRTATLVLLDAADPLVSGVGVRRWVAERGLASWSVEVIGDRAPAGAAHRHLVVSETVLGPLAWRRSTEAMLEHLRDPRRPG